MDILNDLWFYVLMVIKAVPVFALKLLLIYFVIKIAVKKALLEHQKSLEEGKEKK